MPEQELVDLDTVKHAVQTFTRLLKLDDEWTEALQRGGDLRKPERVHLLQVGDEMMHLITASVTSMGAIDQIAHSRDGTIADILPFLSELPKNDVAVVADLVEVCGGYLSGLTAAVALQISTTAVEARIDLRGKIAELDRGVPGIDLIPSFICALAAATMVGGVVAVWIPPHVWGLTVIGGGKTVWHTMKCSRRDLQRASQDAASRP